MTTESTTHAPIGPVDLAAEREAVGVGRGQVLERVDGQVDGAVEEVAFEFEREQPLPADLGERLVERPVALGDERDERHVEAGPRGAERGGDVLGLPECEAGGARPETQAASHRGRARAGGARCRRRPRRSGWRR